MTDGSGHTDRSRLASTTAVLERAGARPGSIYGRFSDRELYRAILAANADVFIRLAEELASTLDREAVDYVVGDAVEGVNPGHDVCRLVLNAAVSRTRRRPSNFEFLVEGPPDQCPPEEREEAILLELGDEAYKRKLDAVLAYRELAVDVDRILAAHAQDAFRFEWLRPVRYGLEISDRFEHPAVYERYGEKQVAEGLYSQVIRFREHLAVLAERLGT